MAEDQDQSKTKPNVRQMPEHKLLLMRWRRRDVCTVVVASHTISISLVNTTVVCM